MNVSKVKLSLIVGLLSLVVLAQNDYASKLESALNQATSVGTGVFDSIVSLIFVISGLSAVVALARIAWSFFSDDKDVSRKVVMWFAGSIVIFIGVGVVRTLFF